MRLRRRSFPHPVVGNADDVPAAQFQATFDVDTSPTGVGVSLKVACSSRTLASMIAKKEAVHVLHIECSNTLYRRAFQFSTPEFTTLIEPGLLNDVVELNAAVVAARDKSSYKVEGAHADYGKATFSLKRGDLLAVGGTRTIFVEQTQDALRPIASIIQVVRSPEAGDHAMRVDYNSEKIKIFLCGKDFDFYARLKGVKAASGQLIATLVLPVLIDAVHKIRSSQGTFSNLRWHECLTHRLEGLGLGPNPDPLLAAQAVLEMPVRRAFIGVESLCQQARE